jgi:hypothetical protein
MKLHDVTGCFYAASTGSGIISSALSGNEGAASSGGAVTEGANSSGAVLGIKLDNAGTADRFLISNTVIVFPYNQYVRHIIKPCQCMSLSR